MKINADYREFKDLDDIINDMELTISEWTEERQRKSLPYLDSYINDWYHEYELTKEDFATVAEMVKDFFEED